MRRAFSKEVAAGLMTLAMAIPLVSTPGSYTLPDNATALGFTVPGSVGSNAGLTVAIPLSDSADEHASKARRRVQVHQKQPGS